MRTESPIDFIRYNIKEYGFLSATKIIFLLKDYYPKLNNNKINKILNNIVGDDIYKVEYTNKYVAPYTKKLLYLYNPDHCFKKKPTKKKTKS